MSEPKEPNFFNRRYEQKEWYASLFQEWSGQAAIGEASTSTMLFASLTAKRIADTLPEAKLIFLLRNPIDRLFSDYWFNVRQGRISDPKVSSFSGFIRKETTTPARWPADASEEDIAIRRGYYDRQLQVFDKYFDSSQTLIIVSKDLKANREMTLRRVFEFIHVDDLCEESEPLVKNEGGYVSNKGIYNISRMVWSPVKKVLPGWFLSSSHRLRTNLRMSLFFSGQKPTMNQRDRNYLRDLYADTIASIRQRLGRDLSHWR